MITITFTDEEIKEALEDLDVDNMTEEEIKEELLLRVM